MKLFTVTGNMFLTVLQKRHATSVFSKEMFLNLGFVNLNVQKIVKLDFMTARGVQKCCTQNINNAWSSMYFSLGLSKNINMVYEILNINHKFVVWAWGDSPPPPHPI